MFKTPEEFILGLGIDDTLKENIQPFVDGNVGFCLSVDYSDNDYKSRQGDEKCLIKVLYEKDSPNKIRNDEVVPISFIVRRGVIGGIISQALYKTEAKFGFGVPLDFDLKEKFRYDHSFKSLSFDSRTQSFSAVVNNIFDLHIKPCKPIAGFKIRAYRFSAVAVDRSLSSMRRFIEFVVLKIVLGKIYAPVFTSSWDAMIYGFKDERFVLYRMDWLHRIKDEEIVYQNIKTTKNVIISSCFTWIGVFILINFYPPISKLAGTAILSAIAAILTVFTFESLLPRLTLLGLNCIVRIQRILLLEKEKGLNH